MGVDVLLQSIELPGTRGLQGQALCFSLCTGLCVGVVLLARDERGVGAFGQLLDLYAGGGEIRAAITQLPAQPGTARVAGNQAQQHDAQPQRYRNHCTSPPAAR